QKTGLTARQLDYLRRLRLLPVAKFAPTTEGGHPTFLYPDTVLDRIRRIKTLQAHGLSLAHIAREHARQSPHLLRAGRPPDPKVTP
ncbi:unnamed protein product, partial [marine sediment metagenome]